MRQHTSSQWKILGRIDGASQTLAASLNISPVAARVLLNRVPTCRDDPETARKFMHPTLNDLHDPYLMKDMDRAVERLKRAVRNKEKILIHGDYDVDGISATAMMVRMLSALEAEVSFHIPHRILEGYGVSEEALRRAAEEGVKLVVTVDCGITAHEEARLAKELGLDLIITDHHQPHSDLRLPIADCRLLQPCGLPIENQKSKIANQNADLPPAVAVLNPNRPDCEYPFKGLCGCGVAFKLSSALIDALGVAPMYRGQEHLQRAFLDLVALGTIADIVPLVDENRVIARFGLERLTETKKSGLKALIEAAGLTGKRLSSYHVGFMLGPRLNAAGRLESARAELGSNAALNLLLTRDEKEAKNLAQQLSDLNRNRQEEEASTVEDACLMIESGVDACGLNISSDSDKGLVLASENWHPGVVGIVASRLVERFHRPTIVIAMEQDRGKGSGRSIPAFHLFNALDRCREFVIECGGHAQAAGLSIAREQLERFQQRFLSIASEELNAEDLAPQVKVDCEVQPEDLNYQLAHELSLFEPFGERNPRPQLAMRGVTLLSHSVVGSKGNLMKLRVKHGKSTHECLWWRKMPIADLQIANRKSQILDLCVTPEINDYQGYGRLQLVVKDARAA